MPASAHFCSCLLEVQHWWFIINGPCETFSMLEMRSTGFDRVALCDDVLLSVAIFLCWLLSFCKGRMDL